MIHNRAFYIPKESTPFTIEGFAAIVYFHEASNGAVYAVGFRGKAQKPAFNYRFNSPARRSEYCFGFLCDEAQGEERKGDRRAEAKAVRAAFVNPLKVGDVIYNSWGYEQTNVDFYQIVEVKGKSITMRKIGQKADAGRSTGHDSEYRLPVFDWFIGEPFKKTVQPNGYENGYSISFKSGSGSFWGNKEKPGNAKYCSWYH